MLSRKTPWLREKGAASDSSSSTASGSSGFDKCSGWAPSDGAWKGLGGTCSKWGWSTRWCFADKSYDGPGMEFLKASPNYPGKYYAPCGDWVISKQPGQGTGQASLAGCSGWAPATGEDKGLGSSCKRWGKSSRWCFVEKSYEGPGKEFVTESTSYSGKYYAPCGDWVVVTPHSTTVVGPGGSSVAPVVAGGGSAGGGEYAAAGITCSGWSPAGATTPGLGSSCEKWGWTVRWCFVANGYAGPGKEFVTPSNEYQGKYFMPCGDWVLKEGNQPPVPSASAGNSPAVTAGDAATAVGPVANVGSTIPNTVGCSGWSPPAGPTAGHGSACQKWGWTVRWCFVETGYAGLGKEFVTESGEYPGKLYVPCGEWVSKAASTIAKEVQMHKEKASSTSATSTSGPVQCSGWAAPDGEYKGQGSSCAKWGWSIKWCFVEKDYKGPGNEFVTQSAEYPDKHFLPCGDFIASGASPVNGTTPVAPAAVDGSGSGSGSGATAAAPANTTSVAEPAGTEANTSASTSGAAAAPAVVPLAVSAAFALQGQQAAVSVTTESPSAIAAKSSAQGVTTAAAGTPVVPVATAAASALSKAASGAATALVSGAAAATGAAAGAPDESAGVAPAGTSADGTTAAAPPALSSTVSASVAAASTATTVVASAAQAASTTTAAAAAAASTAAAAASAAAAAAARICQDTLGRLR